jgi:transcriptional regulator with XRE-family HTH domain
MTRNIGTKAQVFDSLFNDGMRKMREKRGLSRRELGELAGMPEYTIGQIETGYGKPRRRSVTVGEAIVLAEALEAKVGDLIRAATGVEQAVAS